MESDVAHVAHFYKAWAWFENNKRQVALGIAALAVVGLVIWFVLWQRGERQVAAGEALSRVIVPQATGSSRSENPEAYLKVAANYPNSDAGARALLLGATGLFVDGKYAEAQTQFEKFTREHHSSPLLGQALLGIAACLDAQGKANEAITAYRSLIDRRAGENVIPQAKFSLARLYEAQNKPELARPLYEDVARDPYGSLGSEAGMRLEELKTRFPNLAPAATASAAAPSPAVPTNAVPLKSQKK